MNRTLYILIAVLILLLTACGSQSPMDPAAVMDAYTTAINAHDVEAALQYVADDAVYDRPTRLSKNPWFEKCSKKSPTTG